MRQEKTMVGKCEEDSSGLDMYRKEEGKRGPSVRRHRGKRELEKISGGRRNMVGLTQDGEVCIRFV